MALNFPTSPSNGATYTSGSTTWQYDGTAWNVVGNTSSVSLPNNFTTIGDVSATIPADSLTFTAGSNITITPDAETKTITFASTGGGGGGGEGEANQNAFSTISVAGNDAVEADDVTDTVTFVAGSNMTITTDGTTDTITFASTGGGGGGATTFSGLTDATTAGLNVSDIYEPALLMFRVDNDSATAYRFLNHYGAANNPTIYVIGGATVAFDLTLIPGHPFAIQDNTLTEISTGLVHVGENGTISLDANAQGKDTGVLYWRVPENPASTTYVYQCRSHASMFGTITVKRLSVI